MNSRDTTFRFPVARVLPLLGGFLFLLMIIAGSFVVGSYPSVVMVVLWILLIASGWYGLSDLLVQVTVREENLQIRSLSLRGVQMDVIPWSNVQELNLSGHMPDELKLWARKGVSISKWTLPAHVALARVVIQRADLKPDPANDPPGVSQAFDRLLQTKGRRDKFGLHWQWRGIERELGDE
jgi:hypothetical protein